MVTRPGVGFMFMAFSVETKCHGKALGEGLREKGAGLHGKRKQKNDGIFYAALTRAWRMSRRARLAW